MKNLGNMLVWLGAALILIGLIIVIVIMPGWLWCVLGALALIGAGVLLLRPVLRR